MAHTQKGAEIHHLLLCFDMNHVGWSVVQNSAAILKEKYLAGGEGGGGGGGFLFLSATTEKVYPLDIAVLPKNVGDNFRLSLGEVCYMCSLAVYLER